MSHPQFLPDTAIACLGHAVEEAGEFLAAAGKIQRFGFMSVNPLLPPAERETNLAWLRREAADLRQALDRLDAKLDLAFGPAAPQTLSETSL